MDADEVREIARGFRERDIPCDALYLDIDYMDGYRVFTFDARALPRPGGASSPSWASRASASSRSSTRA